MLAATWRSIRACCIYIFLLPMFLGQLSLLPLDFHSWGFLVYHNYYATKATITETKEVARIMISLGPIPQSNTRCQQNLRCCTKGLVWLALHSVKKLDIRENFGYMYSFNWHLITKGIVLGVQKQICKMFYFLLNFLEIPFLLHILP